MKTETIPPWIRSKSAHHSRKHHRSRNFLIRNGGFTKSAMPLWEAGCASSTVAAWCRIDRHALWTSLHAALSCQKAGATPPTRSAYTSPVDHAGTSECTGHAGVICFTELRYQEALHFGFRAARATQWALAKSGITRINVGACSGRNPIDCVRNPLREFILCGATLKQNAHRRILSCCRHPQLQPRRISPSGLGKRFCSDVPGILSL